MDKPLTARTFALILWGPIVAGWLLLKVYAAIQGSMDVAQARNAESRRAMIETRARGEELRAMVNAEHLANQMDGEGDRQPPNSTNH